jgi:opacity protein-like surface antigen
MAIPYTSASAVLAAVLVSSAFAGEPTAPVTEDAGLSLAGLPFYVEVFGGTTSTPNLSYSSTDYNMDTGYNVGGAVGTALNQRVDVEFEAFYAETSYKSYDDRLSNLSLMFNVFYNQPLIANIVGYVGAGAGPTQVKYSTSSDSNADWTFAYQLIAGVRYPVTENIDIFAEYRFSDLTTDAELFGDTDVEFTSRNVSIGARYKF